MSAPLRVGVIGLGARCVIAENCHKATIPAELVGGCDPNPAMRQRATEVLGDYPWFETLDELLELGIDCAIVTSPDDTHEDITCALLEAGVAVYLEKPIAITIEGSDRVLETAYRTKTPLYVGHNMRHMAVVRILRQVVQDGLIGEVRAIWCRHFVGNGGDYYFKDWHADRSRTTGLLLQKAAHDIDVMNWLSDSVPERVVGMGDLMLYGKLSDRSGQKSDAVMSDWFSFDNWPPASLTGLNPVIDVEDVSMLMMRQASGTLISYEQCHFTPVVRGWKHRSGWEPTGDIEIPIKGDAGGHDDADVATMDEFLRFVAKGDRTDTTPLGAREAVAAGVLATKSLREGSLPFDVPRVSPELTRYFENNQDRGA